MEAGIIGIGSVGRAAALAAMQRGSASELVLVDRTATVSKAVALDLGYGIPLGPSMHIVAGDYSALAGAGIVVVTAGVNEKAGGAIDRNDPSGRLRLLDQNVRVMQDVIPRVADSAPGAVIVIATDPPDPLADVTRALAPKAKVFSTGTFLDSLRFRTQLGHALGVNPLTVRADVLHWVVAERQEQTAARNMFGRREAFDAVPFFWSMHYDVPILYVGHAKDWDSIEIDGEVKARNCRATYRRGGRTLAVVTIGRYVEALRAEVELERQTYA